MVTHLWPSYTASSPEKKDGRTNRPFSSLLLNKNPVMAEIKRRDDEYLSGATQFDYYQRWILALAR